MEKYDSSDLFNGKTKEEIVKQISELRKNIKRKHRMYKSEMLDSEELWENKLKPISEPLKQLVEEGEKIQQKVNDRKRKIELEGVETPLKRYLPAPPQGIKRKQKINIPFQPGYASDESTEDGTDGLPVSKRRALFQTPENIMEVVEDKNDEDDINMEKSNEEEEEMIVQPQEEVFSSEISGQELLKTPQGKNAAKEYIEHSFKGNLAKEYFLKLIKGLKTIDHTYGVRVDGNNWKIGDKVIEIDINDVIIDGKRYSGTRGLYELIFMNIPNEYTYDEVDLDNYAMLLRQTNAHRANYSALGKIKSNRGSKYKRIISHIVARDVTSDEPMITYADEINEINRRHSASFNPLINKDVTGKGILLTNSKPNVVYYDDPNELVDRLRVILPSQEAGNTAHKNEINAIFEELLEWEKEWQKNNVE